MQLSTSQRIPDPAHDVLRYQHQPLDAIFAPKSVAIVGATEKPGSVGRTLLWNLISSPFGGTVYPVNPKRRNVLGIKAYAAIAEIPEPVDLAIIVTPAPTVPGLIRECADVGVKGAVIISAGFKEIGQPGVELERQILEQARRGKMRIVGPNCLGVMNPLSGLNATFAPTIARPGNVGFISQSGALCTAVLDWSFRENVGFSAFVSVGSMVDVGWGDLIYYLGDDPHTQSIVMYMESIGDARSFLSAAREVALTKPIIAIKVGRTAAAAQAAASHTGSLTGSDEVLDAAFRRCGVLRVNTIDDLFNMAEVLAKQPRPKGRRLTILTNAGGPGVLATDALISGQGELAPLEPATVAALDPILPKHWSHANPIDILGDAEPERYAKSLEIAAKDPSSDGILVILTPQSMSDPTQTAEQVVKTLQESEISDKPILASWMGGANVAAGEEILNQASIFTFPYPDTAARVFNLMWRYSYNLRGIYETPVLPDVHCRDLNSHCPDRDSADRILQAVRNSRRSLLTELESKQLLAAYGIPTVTTQIATSAEEAAEIAQQIGYPVVLKLHSETITHKTDVGGVRLLLKDAETVKRAYHAIEESVGEKVGSQHFLGVTVQPMMHLEGYEIILGSSLDSQFGPVLLFGTGGQLVEVFQDRALALPPLNTTLARRMMEQTRIYTALKGVRGRQPVDLAALEQLLVRFSQLVVEQPWIKEIDINPLLVSSERIIALDARIVLHDPEAELNQIPRLAIRPYPTQYVSPWIAKDGTTVTIRPIRPEDEPLMVKFHQTLSEESVYLRYFHMIKLQTRVAHDRLTRICFIDYDREMALVADCENPETGEHEILGVSRLSKLHGTNEAEFGMLISDRAQGKGIGTELLRRLLQVGKDENLEQITAEILSDNRPMQRICEKLGFKLKRQMDIVEAVYPLE
ncbi:bifunctional acetate--CoA ligase family protein/GNAT family N-acetyltransferase [Desertifilum sp. FACHB-1129]|uniref:Acetyl CoA synthetase subunit alpha n=1 Tax=Desertifilum tharense IPPAS B-1220 TaxID=1781255 RepID=A0A1E5QQZ8_9CYAN|nr:MULTISPECIES: bifunctional acetate--CoA ligase family protein/GNAT family N-acetyltransferase [Desertifilum]MDA0210797.1 bifunctional acetate--CoA ligase family protein/GNAT family N-acetyltransferase [Cyanobacteria bacterium FC1]MBD2312283.1 bifunctional acetate--CoA ligase family protein/GNAT family N-acetyltransferase [Desertifilum sp. FACHB-1129]MBD2323650.1 bifunctional acetate--CoA ligase family protein/GNAT family N-acetyltransferase [Desertifilum sp. FACHB-866]MBD2332347.1 bifunction